MKFLIAEDHHDSKKNCTKHTIKRQLCTQQIAAYIHFLATLQLWDSISRANQ